MSNEIQRLTDMMCQVAWKLEPYKLMFFGDGNLSVRTADPQGGGIAYLVSCTSKRKADLRPEGIGLFALNGGDLRGEVKTVTRDWPTHRAIYGATQATAVLHTHGLMGFEYAKMFSGKALDHPLGNPLAGENYLGSDDARLGLVYVTQPEVAGTEEIAAKVASAVGVSRAVFVPGSGLYVYSTREDSADALWDCFNTSNYVEARAGEIVREERMREIVNAALGKGIASRGASGSAMYSDFVRCHAQDPASQLPLMAQVEILLRQ